MDNKLIIQKLDHAKNLPTLPAVALKVNEMLKDYDVSVEQLTKVIEKDPAIVLKLLKLVNSAFFGLKSKIKNIPHAVTLMGFNTLRNAVITVSIIDAFKLQHQIEGFDIKNFWSHAIKVAVIAKYLALDSRLTPPEEAFTLGLLHDMGKLVQLIVFPDLFERIQSEIRNKKMTYLEAENSLGIMSHARMGAYLAGKWSLPQDVVDVVKYHHNVLKENVNYHATAVVHVADVLVNATLEAETAGHSLCNLGDDTKNLVLNALKKMPEWFPKAKFEIETACRFFMEE